MQAILYSYRRCPYAIRARMALKYASIEFEHREIELKNKPQSMLLVSPKGTVPVLCVDGIILEQSLDIMHWALKMNDPNDWLLVDDVLAKKWIERNDSLFKPLLDQYKYPNRYSHINAENVLSEIESLILTPMEEALTSSQYLLGNELSWVDVAIFPFIRQFSMVNQEIFQGLSFPLIKRWLNEHIESELFNSVMHKYPSWID